jgi:uroporphyrinogen decarboxylase
MTGRERVLRTLNRQRADCIPLDFGGTDCSSIHSLAYLRLRRKMGLPIGPVRCGCLMQLIAELDGDVQDFLGTDVEALFFGSRETKIWHAPFGVDLVVPKGFAVEDLPDGSSIVRDAAGGIAARRAADACYFDPGTPVLAQIKSAKELEQFDAVFDRWDYPAAYDEPLEDMARRARQQYQSTSRAVAVLWNLHYLQAGQMMRGFQQFFVDLMTDRDLAHAILAKLHQAYMRRVDAFCRAMGDAFDVAFLCDDLGTQQSGLISPALYREMVFPYVSELVGAIKSHGKKVIMHSCGAVAKYIPFLIEMGVDALNPVQVSAKGMNPRDLVREFGRDIAFWGGGCDTQHALNSPDPEVVRADVRRRLDEFGPDAFLVFTQVHNIQYDVPPENILALRDEFWKRARS